ncbi:type I glyceraldehyde-3-phosphate dehydrogenase [Patescibacteria group bacterium]|nr:MAG: type I glyceraldehyde-3-phosphate dehydrogenase [Patescibacteria group bacterium]
MPKKIRIAINGFGRIGRTAFKAALSRPDIMRKIEVVAVNDLMEPATLAHLLAYDSVFRRTAAKIRATKTHLIVNGQKILVTAEKDPATLPWKKLDVDVVLECTGRFTSRELASGHVRAGARHVIVSAPAKETPTYLMGVNVDARTARQKVLNNASCTTNCVGPVTAVIESRFGIRKAAMTTIHAVTAEQNLVDGPPPGGKKGDLRRARSALVNMIPTTTGAAVAATEALPRLKGKFDGMAIRVPVLDVSLSDFTFLLKKKTTVEQVNAAFVKASQHYLMKGILGVSDVPLVSSDYIGSTYSAVVDLPYTKVIDGDLLKVLAWYDNEWGYSHRLIEMAVRVGKK